MSDSQTWADAMALAVLLHEPLDEGYYEQILSKYAMQDDQGVWVDVKLVTALIILLSSMLDAWAQELDEDLDEVVNSLLIEKFKRDMDEVDG